MQDWELESWLNFMDTIYGASVRSGKDKMCWEPDKKKGFQLSGFQRSCFILLFSLFLGKAYGNQKFLLELPSLFGLLS